MPGVGGIGEVRQVRFGVATPVVSQNSVSVAARRARRRHRQRKEAAATVDELGAHDAVALRLAAAADGDGQRQRRQPERGHEDSLPWPRTISTADGLLPAAIELLRGQGFGFGEGDEKVFCG